jgi:thymidylate synthase (FAD)
MAEILKNAGTYTILTPPEELKAQLRRIEEAGRTCYQSYKGTITDKTASKFVRMVLRRGHESVIEHSCMTVRFSLLSRGFTHEAIRHRLCAFSQESTRYVDYAPRVSGESEEVDLDAFQLKCVAPPHRDENEVLQVDLSHLDVWSRYEHTPHLQWSKALELTPASMFGVIEAFYRTLRKSGWKPEDARQFLPIGTKAEIIVSANFREWRHIFKMRTEKYAHWEIRRVMGNLLEEMKTIIPVMFADFEEAGVDNTGLRHFKKLSKYP